MILSKNCPCGHGPYAECCQPLHLKQQSALNAEQLMRSRYSAFALQQIDYILETTALGQQSALDRIAIADWSQWYSINPSWIKPMRWLNLRRIIMMVNKPMFIMKFHILYYTNSSGISLIRRWICKSP